MKTGRNTTRGPTNDLNPHLFDDVYPFETERCACYRFSQLVRWSTPVWWPYSLEEWMTFYDMHLGRKINDEPNFYLDQYTELPTWFDGTREEWEIIAISIAHMHDDILKEIKNDPQYKE